MSALDSIAILTANRPHLALRCAESYLSNHSHPAELHIFDDSPDPEAALIPDLAAHLAQTYGVPVRFARREERRRYASQLAALGIPREVAEFVLLGDPAASFTAGANRNAALLDAVDQRLLMADDDTIATTAAACNHTEQPLVGVRRDPTDIESFEPGAARAAANWLPVDLIAETANLLGSSVAEAAVRITSYGLVGDSGFFSPSHLLWNCSPAMDAKLRQSEPLLKTLFTSREVIRIAPRLTITHATVCMATTIGLDHTRPLPPFLPVCRNEDGFFGNLLIRAFPTACTAYLPYAVIHDPPGTRGYDRLPHKPQRIRISELLTILMAAGPGKSLDALGRFLVEISGENFESFARDAVRRSRGKLLRYIEHRWAQSPVPPSPLWLQLTGELRTSLTALIESPECHIPSDFPQSELARVIRLTGRMLIHWSEIVNAARELSARNVRVTEPALRNTPALLRHPHAAPLR